jgi:type IV pilus assembly protein PilY1
MHTPIRHIVAAALTGLMLVPTLAHPEDTDIYSGAGAGGYPNVLIVLDNEANWSATMDSSPPSDADSVASCGGVTGSYYCAQKYALIKLLQQKIRTATTSSRTPVGVGIMMYGSGGNKGGYIRFAVRKMTPANRAALIKILKGLDITADKGSSTQDYGLMMWEAFKYYGGGSGTPWSSTTWGPIPTNGVGVGASTRDYAGNVTTGSAYWANGNAAIPPYAYTSSSTALTGAGSVQYVPPTPTSECGKNYIVYVGHSDSQATTTLRMRRPISSVSADRQRASARARPPRGRGCALSVQFRCRPQHGRHAERHHLHDRYLSAAATGQIASMITTMKSMATQGGGSYYDATSIQKLSDAFGAIFTEVQGISSVFASASLPVSANTQGTFLNQVFIGMFRPDANGSPVWQGNVKQYQFKYDSTTGAVRLADADGLDAIDANTGFLSVLARSYWTTSSAFWANWVPGQTATASDSKDGPEVQKAVRRSDSASRI